MTEAFEYRIPSNNNNKKKKQNKTKTKNTNNHHDKVEPGYDWLWQL